MLSQRVTTVGGSVGRHDQHLRGTLERPGKARWFGEIAPADADAPPGEFLCFLRIADAHADLPGRDECEQSPGDGLAELAGGSGDDDHGIFLWV